MNASLSTAAPWWRPNTGHRLMVRGGRPLVGTYPISGAKNAVLPLMVSALLTPHLVTLRNVPANLDVAVLAALLERLGCGMHWSTADSGLTVTIAADRVQPRHIDAELVTRMRASVLLLGALLARCGEAALPMPMPGGDAIGLRGIDFHVTGLRAMGATIELTDGTIRATARAGLRGADILLPQPSVGATENLLLAAVAAAGTTTIRNAAREPEIADLATCLIAGRQDRGPRHACTDHRGRGTAGRRRSRRAARPHRIRHARLRRRPDRWRTVSAARTDRPAWRCRGVVRGGRSQPARHRRWGGRPARQGRADRHRSHDCALSGLRDRPAGPDDGAAGRGDGNQCDHRKHLRAALPPCRRVAKDGCGHCRTGPHGADQGRRAPARRRRHMHRRTRGSGPRPGRTGSRGRDNPRRPRPPRSRLRWHGGHAGRVRRRHHAPLSTVSRVREATATYGRNR